MSCFTLKEVLKTSEQFQTKNFKLFHPNLLIKSKKYPIRKEQMQMAILSIYCILSLSLSCIHKYIYILILTPYIGLHVKNNMALITYAYRLNYYKIIQLYYITILFLHNPRF